MKNKRISKKQLSEFLTKNFNIVKTTKMGLEDAPDSYVSKIDGSYLTFVGLEEDVKYLLKNGITEGLQNAENVSDYSVNIGFNPEEQKWYGWSHRAIFGFGVGSTCKKGDCGYKPANKKEFQDACLDFWGDLDISEDGGVNSHKKNQSVREEERKGKLGAYVEYTFTDDVPNKSLKGKTDGFFSEYPEKWGRGEWTAETLDEAKEMAIDFAEGVS